MDDPFRDMPMKKTLDLHHQDALFVIEKEIHIR